MERAAEGFFAMQILCGPLRFLCSINLRNVPTLQKVF